MAVKTPAHAVKTEGVVLATSVIRAQPKAASHQIKTSPASAGQAKPTTTSPVVKHAETPQASSPKSQTLQETKATAQYPKIAAEQGKGPSKTEPSVKKTMQAYDGRPGEPISTQQNKAESKQTVMANKEPEKPNIVQEFKQHGAGCTCPACRAAQKQEMKVSAESGSVSNRRQAREARRQSAPIQEEAKQTPPSASETTKAQDIIPVTKEEKKTSIKEEFKQHGAGCTCPACRAAQKQEMKVVDQVAKSASDRRQERAARRQEQNTAADNTATRTEEAIKTDSTVPTAKTDNKTSIQEQFKHGAGCTCPMCAGARSKQMNVKQEAKGPEERRAARARNKNAEPSPK